MTTYILLRDNKESIPLSLNDLRNLGLKATDLIWVEGQSVCWMNPGQIKELKDLGFPAEPVATEIPVIEEQEALVTPLAEEPAVVPVPSPVTEAAHKEEKTESLKPKIQQPKNVFVELPHTEKKPSLTSDIFNRKKEQEPKRDVFPVAETKYSKPLDEIKELYLENLEKQRQQKTWQVPPQVKKAAVYVVLFISGIAAGLLINKMFSRKDTFAQAADSRIASAQSIKQEEQSPVDSSAFNAVTSNEMTESQTEAAPTSIHDKVYQQTYKTIQQSAETTSVENAVLPDPAPAEPEPLVKTEEPREVRKPSIREIYSQVGVKKNDYTVGSFGGIKNLELTVSNHSKYSLDEVSVIVQYLKPGDELIKSETIIVKGIGPGASKTIPVKKTSRGVKVVTKVGSIESKDFMNSTAGL